MDNDTAVIARLRKRSMYITVYSCRDPYAQASIAFSTIAQIPWRPYISTMLQQIQGVTAIVNSLQGENTRQHVLQAQSRSLVHLLRATPVTAADFIATLTAFLKPRRTAS